MSRLGALAAPRPAPAPRAEDELERCELCGEPLPEEHRHLVDLQASRLLCACRACSLLFDRPEAGGERYRLVPDRRLAIDGFRLSEAQWDALRIPVRLAFLFRSTPAGRVVAFYPGPLGATESLLDLGEWAGVEEENPVLATVQADVEALLVNRTQTGAGAYVVPIDACYALVGLMRSRWQGLGGGDAAWAAIAGFFDDLRRRARTVGHDGREAR
jgi:hypothetical protein